MRTYCIIDVSSLLHTTFHGLYRRAIFTKEPYGRDSVLTHFDSRIKAICKNYNISAGNMLFAFDCRREKIWRHQVVDKYAEDNPTEIKHIYKGDRKKGSVANGEEFDIENYRASIMWLKERCHIQSYYGNDIEADDVIYLMTKCIPDSDRILLVSSDGDFCQIRHPGLVLIDPKTGVARDGWCDMTDRDKQYSLVMKVLQGDKSDNIRKCIRDRNCGPAAEMIVSGEGDPFKLYGIHRSRFDHNMALINMDRIPDNLKEFHIPRIRKVVELSGGKFDVMSSITSRKD